MLSCYIRLKKRGGPGWAGMKVFLLIVFIYDSTLSDYLLISKASDFEEQNGEYEIIYNNLIQKNFNFIL